MADETEGIVISTSMLAAMAEQGYALVLIHGDAVRFIKPEETPHG